MNIKFLEAKICSILKIVIFIKFIQKTNFKFNFELFIFIVYSLYEIKTDTIMWTKILNFIEAIKFMNERAAYYEEIGEPADFEVHAEIGDDKLWIRQLCVDLFDVLIESEQPSFSVEVTHTFNFEELQEMLEDSNIEKFLCGPVFDRTNLKIRYDK